MPFLFWDPTMIILIPAFLFAMWAQFRVKSTIKKYSNVRSSSNVTGYEVARRLLERNGISDVEVEETVGKLTDHYDPKSKTVRLSSENFRGGSIAAIGVAAHEVGHAIQDSSGYAALRWRHSFFPVARIGSQLWIPLFFIGLIFTTPVLMDVGIILFAATVLFQVVTLPVEFNASSRAMIQLESGGYITKSEAEGARKVLNAAALTYVAAAAVAIAHLLRLLILRGRD